MPTTYQHKALIEELKKLSSQKAADENPSEETLNSSHQSSDSSVDDDSTTTPVVGSRFAENTQANQEMNPQGTESAPDNKIDGGLDSYGHNAAPSGEGEVPAVLADDPQDPASSHPASGKEAAVTALLRQAAGIKEALYQVIKKAEGEDLPEAQTEFPTDDSSTVALPEDNDNITIADADGSTTASKEGMVQAIKDLEKAASSDADSFATVCMAIMGKTDVMKKAMDEILEAAEGYEEDYAEEASEEEASEEEASEEESPEEEASDEEVSEEEASDEEVEEVLADMAMAGAAAPAEEAIIEEAAPAMAGAEEELSPEEQALLMELLSAEGMGAEDIDAYGKMAHAAATGQLDLRTIPKVQQQYFYTCHNAAKTAAQKIQGYRTSSKLSGSLNTIYNREAR